MLNVSIKWKIISVLKGNPLQNTNDDIYKIGLGSNLYKKKFRIPLKYCYAPYRFYPTIHFHDALKNYLKRKYNFNLQFKGFPYVFSHPETNEELNIEISNIRFFPPRIIAFTFNLLNKYNRIDPNHLIDLQKIIRTNPIRDIIERVIGISEAFNLIDYEPHNSFVHKPFIHIDGICSTEHFQNDFDEHLAEYIGILIRNKHYKYMSSHIPNSIIKKNESINIKSSEKLLIDKQGILYLTPNIKNKVYSRTQVHDLCELAIVIESFLKHYDNFYCDDPKLVDSIMLKLSRWLEKPNSVMTNSVSHQMIWNLMLDEFIRSRDLYFINKKLIDPVVKNNKDELNLRVTKKGINKKKRKRVFISYSHADKEWLKRIQIHIKPFEKKGIIDSWDDTKIKAGMRWKHEIINAIETAKVAVLLVSADFLASEFITDNELPLLLQSAEKEGTIILPVIIKPCFFSFSELSHFQSINAPSNALIGMSEHDQEKIFSDISKRIHEALSI